MVESDKKATFNLGGEFIIDYPVIFGGSTNVNRYAHFFFNNYKTGQIDINGTTEKAFEVGNNFKSSFYNDFTYDPISDRYLALDVVEVDNEINKVYLYAFNSDDFIKPTK